jgi:hypothetical protein
MNAVIILIPRRDFDPGKVDDTSGPWLMDAFTLL